MRWGWHLVLSYSGSGAHIFGQQHTKVHSTVACFAHEINSCSKEPRDSSSRACWLTLVPSECPLLHRARQGSNIIENREQHNLC